MWKALINLIEKWGIAKYLFGGKSVVVFGIGKWDEEYVGK